MIKTSMKPVKKAEWAKLWNTVTIDGNMRGMVVKIVNLQSYTSATVQWDNGSTGRHNIALLKVVKET